MFQLKDLLHFLIIAMMFIIGVGVFYHACLYPDHKEMFGSIITWYGWHVWKILKYPYWQLYGETFIEFLDGKISFKYNSMPSFCNNSFEKSLEVSFCFEGSGLS